MNIYLANQRPHFAAHLHRLQQVAVQPYSRPALRHKLDSIAIPGASIAQLDAAAILDYRIFPETILTAYRQWEHQGRQLLPGDTIVQQIYIPPLGAFSQKIIAGVRVLERYDTASCRGFAYETLEGHVERGVSAFRLQQTAIGVAFSIETWSAPSGLLPRLMAPVAGWYQGYCTRLALAQVAAAMSAQQQG